MGLVPDVDAVLATDLGWKRRPDEDRPGLWAWEMPDGRLFAHHEENTPVLMVLRELFHMKQKA